MSGAGIDKLVILYVLSDIMTAHAFHFIYKSIYYMRIFVMNVYFWYVCVRQCYGIYFHMHIISRSAT